MKNKAHNVKSGFFNGIQYESSYEKAAIMFWQSQGWDVARVDTPIPYHYKGKVKEYYPDFCITKGQHFYIMELKGHIYPNAKEKVRCKIAAAREKYGSRFLYYTTGHPTMKRMMRDLGIYLNKMNS